MARIARVRVEKQSEGGSKYDDERAFKSMFQAFKKKCDDAGIKHQFKMSERYEKPSEKRNRKKRERLLEQSKKRRNKNPRSKKRK